MAFKEGLYTVEFSTAAGVGAGIVTLFDGKVRGGDSCLLYLGSYTLEGDSFKARIQTRRHAPGMQSVFHIDIVNIQLSGKMLNGNGAMDGTAAEAPGMKFRATLTRVAD